MKKLDDLVVFVFSVGATVALLVWLMERFLEPRLEGWLWVIGR